MLSKILQKDILVFEKNKLLYPYSIVQHTIKHTLLGSYRKKH